MSFVLFAGGVILVLVLAFGAYLRKKRKYYNADESRDLHELLRAFHRENRAHGMEVKLKQITYNSNDMLGEGAFGIVYKGRKMPKNRFFRNGLEQSMDVDGENAEKR